MKKKKAAGKSGQSQGRKGTQNSFLNHTHKLNGLRRQCKEQNHKTSKRKHRR